MGRKGRGGYPKASRHSGRGSGKSESSISQQWPSCIGLVSPILAKRIGLSRICCSINVPKNTSSRRGRCFRLAFCVANEATKLFQSRSTTGKLGRTSPEANVSDARMDSGYRRKMNWTEFISDPQIDRFASHGFAKTESPPVRLGCKWHLNRSKTETATSACLRDSTRQASGTIPSFRWLEAEQSSRCGRAGGIRQSLKSTRSARLYGNWGHLNVRRGTGRTDRKPSFSFMRPITQNPSRIRVISLISSSVIVPFAAALASWFFGFRRDQVRHFHVMTLGAKVLGQDVRYQPSMTFLGTRFRTKQCDRPRQIQWFQGPRDIAATHELEKTCLIFLPILCRAVGFANLLTGCKPRLVNIYYSGYNLQEI